LRRTHHPRRGFTTRARAMTAARADRRRRLIVVGLVTCPLISGLFFGLIAALLVLRGGSVDRATEVGLLVGGVMFASNAVALCIVHTTAQAEMPPPVRSASSRRAEIHAS
jgi:hypothetical protein